MKKVTLKDLGFAGVDIRRPSQRMKSRFPNVVATVSLTFQLDCNGELKGIPNTLQVRGLKIIETDQGELFVSMPNTGTAAGRPFYFMSKLDPNREKALLAVYRSKAEEWANELPEPDLTDIPLDIVNDIDATATEYEFDIVS